MKSGRVWLILSAAGVLALLGIMLGAWLGGLGDVLGDRTAIEQLVHRLGPWGPVAIVAAEIAQVLAAPVPGQVVGLAAGYLYGTWWGALLCMIGLGLGTLLAAWLGRRLGRPLVERLAGAELLARVDGYIERRGALALFLIYLLPYLPDDLCCFIAGLTRLRLSEIVILAMIGRAPGVVASTLIGAQAQQLSWAQIGIIAAASALLAVVFVRYQAPLEKAMFRLLDLFSWQR